jgi:hypothetical protein
MEISLPLQLKKYGVQYQQVIRENDAAIYSLSYPENVSRIIGYDVIRVLRYTLTADHPGFENMEAQLGDIIEHYPSSEQYGKNAWSFSSYESAKRKYDKLLEISKNTG